MSMEINIELPDWIKERHIFIFAGIEEVARKKCGQPWQVKTARCQRCGECCKRVGERWNFGVDPKTGWCSKLKFYANEYSCGIDRPFTCCSADACNEDYCSIEWKEVD